VASATNTGKLSSTDWSTFNNKQNALTNPITGTGASGNVAYFDGPNSITAENSFNYDASLNRLGVNTTNPNATIGANAPLNSGYGLLVKTGASDYNGIGIAIDSTYGNTIEAAKLGSASARNLTLLNQSGFISLTEAGSLGVNILTPNAGVDIYSSTSSSLCLHTANSGITGTDGLRLSLFSNSNGVLRNNEGSLSMSSEGDFSIITIGAENFRVNSADGSIYQSKVANAMLKSVSGVITAAVANTDYQAPITLTTTGTSGAATLVGATLNIPDYSANTTNFVTIGTTQTITGTKTFNEAIRNESGLLLKNGVLSGLVGYTSLAGITNGISVQLSGSSNAQSLIFQSAASYSYTFPASSGTLALTSDLSSYVPTSRTLTINGETYDLSANRSWTITGITGSGAAGRVAYWNGTSSITSEAAFNYDDNLNRFGVNTNSPNATIGANANTDSGYSLLLKNSDTNYSGIGFSTSSIYGNSIETVRIGSAPSRNLTLYNYAGYISITENGSLGVNILTPNNGIDIYNSTQSQLWLHNAASGITSNDGVRLALFNNKSANLRNTSGALSLTAEGDFYIITIGAENFRINSANGYVGIGNPSTLPSMLTVNGGATISGLTTGQIIFPTSGGTLSGSSSLFWDNTNAKLGLGTTTLSGARLTITSVNEAEHLHLVANAPALTFTNALSLTYYAGIGMATASNNFVTGAVQGDLAIGAFNTSSILFYNNNTNTMRMSLNGSGAAIFSGSVTARGPKSQIIADGNSVGAGILLSNSIVGVNRRNWGIFTEQDVEGDFVIKRSTVSGGDAQTGTTILSLSRTGAATFSSSVGIGSSPSAWGANWRPLQMGSYGGFISGRTDDNSLFIGNNVYFNGTDWIGTTTGFATQMFFNSSGDTIFRNTSATAGVATGFNERMRITSAGNVGIGTSSPSGAAGLALVLNSGANQGRICIKTSSTGDASGAGLQIGMSGVDAFIEQRENAALSFATNASERMRITSGGVMQIGGTNSTPWGISFGTVSQVSLNDPNFPFVVAKNDNILGIFNRVGTTGVIIEFKARF